MNDAPRHPPDSAPQDVVGLAAVFSFLLPGLGHVFIGAWLRAAVWFVGWLLVSQSGGGGVNPFVVALMFIAGLDAFLYGRPRESP